MPSTRHQKTDPSFLWDQAHTTQTGRQAGRQATRSPINRAFSKEQAALRHPGLRDNTMGSEHDQLSVGIHQRTQERKIPSVPLSSGCSCSADTMNNQGRDVSKFVRPMWPMSAATWITCGSAARERQKWWVDYGIATGKVLGQRNFCRPGVKAGCLVMPECLFRQASCLCAGRSIFPFCGHEVWIIRV